MWYFWRGWQQCTTMDKTWSRKQPTRRQPRHPPLCPGRSCRCGLAHLQVCWDPPVMGTSLPQTRVRKVGGISVFEGLYQHDTLQTVVLIASYSISDGVCFVLCWKYILSWRTHIMYNLPDVYEQQMSPSYHWRSHNWEKSILSHFSKLQKLYAKTYTARNLPVVTMATDAPTKPRRGYWQNCLLCFGPLTLPLTLCWTGPSNTTATATIELAQGLSVKPRLKISLP